MCVHCLDSSTGFLQGLPSKLKNVNEGTRGSMFRDHEMSHTNTWRRESMRHSVGSKQIGTARFKLGKELRVPRNKAVEKKCK